MTEKQKRALPGASLKPTIAGKLVTWILARLASLCGLFQQPHVFSVCADEKPKHCVAFHLAENAIAIGDAHTPPFALSHELQTWVTWILAPERIGGDKMVDLLMIAVRHRAGDVFEVALAGFGFHEAAHVEAGLTGAMDASGCPEASGAWRGLLLSFRPLREK